LAALSAFQIPFDSESALMGKPRAN